MSASAISPSMARAFVPASTEQVMRYVARWQEEKAARVRAAQYRRQQAHQQRQQGNGGGK